MDSQQFDRLTRMLGTLTSRRSLFKVAIGSCLGLVVSFRSRRSASAGCDTWETDCFGWCKDLANDPENCGACGFVCEAGQYCDGYYCYGCPTGLTDCYGACVDLMSDPNDCGSCLNVCYESGICSYGVCAPCAENQILCGDQCVDPVYDPYNCGGCRITCAAGSSCNQGICECPTGLWDCDNACVDILTDPSNCGGCGTVCVSGSSCNGGLCASYCPEGEILCGDECVATCCNNFNCGGCGIVCTGGTTCFEGVCGCPSGECCPEGESFCYGACVKTGTDEANCGGCGIVCPGGATCVAGVCKSTTTTTTTTTTTPTIDKWSYWKGKSRLRGAHIYQRLLTRTDDPDIWGTNTIGPVYRKADFERLADLGANFVTISHPAIVSTKAPYELVRKVRSNLNDLISLAAEAGLYSVISYRTGPGRQSSSLDRQLACRAGGCFANRSEGDPDSAVDEIWTEKTALEGWAITWEETARAFKNNPLVIGYDLLAFPDPPERAMWDDMAKALVSLIRGIDSDTPIIVTSPGSPTKAMKKLIAGGDHTIQGIDRFAPERYMLQTADDAAPLTYPGRFLQANDGATGAFDDNWLADQLDPIAVFEEKYDVPVTISAFGLPRFQPGAVDFIDDSMTSFEKAGLNHTLWVWYPERWTDEMDDFDLSRGPDPENHESIDNDFTVVIRKHWSKGATLPPIARWTGEEPAIGMIAESAAIV